MVSCCCGRIGRADKVAAAGACRGVGLVVDFNLQRKVCDGIGILVGEVKVTREQNSVVSPSLRSVSRRPVPSA